MQAEYSRQYVELWRRHWWWQSRHAFVLRSVRTAASSFPAGTRPRILDIGCGGGVAFDDLSRFGEVFGIEPDPHLARALPHWSGRIAQRFFDDSYQPEEPFDLALLLDVLEHIEDDHAALAHLHRILRPGGQAIMTVPALPSLWSVHDEVNHHFRRYTHRQLLQRLSAAGFLVRRIHSLYCWSLPLVYLRKWLAKGTEEYSVPIPGRLVNTFFRCLTSLEQTAINVGLRPPTGSSLFAIIERPAEARRSDCESLVHQPANELVLTG